MEEFQSIRVTELQSGRAQSGGAKPPLQRASKTKDKEVRLAVGLEREIDGQEKEGHGEGEEGDGAVIPESAFAMANKAGGGAGQETNEGANHQAVDPGKKMRWLQD